VKRVNFVTLGVQDLPTSKKFLLDLFGWRPKDEKHDDIAMYDMGGWLLALYPWKLLAEDVTVSPDGQGFRGVTLAQNVGTKAEVSEMLERAKMCGAKIIKPAQDVSWGGHSGYFQDLDGFYWEIAWNPFIPILPDGSLEIKSKT
jgi:predicted lactoylglutathione lyase